MRLYASLSFIELKNMRASSTVDGINPVGKHIMTPVFAIANRTLVFPTVDHFIIPEGPSPLIFYPITKNAPAFP